MKRLQGPRPKVRPPGTRTSLVRAYLPAELERQLKERCSADRVTLSAAVTAAVEEWVGGMGDRMVLHARLNALGRKLDRVQRDAELHAKGFAVFMHCWLFHTRSVPLQDRTAASESASKRYAELVRRITDEFSNGSRFIDDLPQEPIADVAELEAIRKKAGASS